MKKIIPHLAAIGLFIVISLAFFYPVLEGKTIIQSDIIQYTAMAKERNDLRKTENQESYWTNSAFGGMPTYQLGANYDYDLVKSLDKTIRFLPRPADYLFLYFVGCYLLLLVLKIDYRTAFLGAVAFGFSTYLIIILGVGHNAKAHAIGYFAPIIAGILLIFRRKYILGGILTAFAFALEINANHYQMTYYLLFLLLILVGILFYNHLKNRELPHFFKGLAILIGAGIVSLLSNSTSLLATQEYAQWSTRGKSTLTISPEGEKIVSNGLSKSYITEYSYGIAESLNLIVPRLFGGSNNETLGEESHVFQQLVKQGYHPSQVLDFVSQLPTYWGQQPIVAAPAYVGAVVFLLFILGLFLVKGTHKWWLLGGSVLALVLSWGKNFGFLTDFMIDYFPLYNKFRAVSSIQVILELCVPVLGFLGLYQFTKNTADENKKPLLHSTFIAIGIVVFLFIIKGFFSFKGINDPIYEQHYGKEILSMIKEERKAMYSSDLLRSCIFMLLTVLILTLFNYKKITKWVLQGALLVLIGFDLVGVANRYVNSEDFVAKRQMEIPFSPSPADLQILKDETHFRVYEPSVGINGARTSYFHKSIGGYHAAKPRKLQELFDYQVSKGNMEVLNMLNVKYILLANEEGKMQPMQNDDALGNAWFVGQISPKKNDDEIMSYLSDFKPITEAILLEKDVKNTTFSVDSTAQITLKSYKPNELIYQSNNPNDGFAVFSEIYYPHGWKATIDGVPAEVKQVNYLLRGMYLPKGTRTIRFSFEPAVVQKGTKIALAGNIILIISVLGGIIWTFIRRKKVKTD